MQTVTAKGEQTVTLALESTKILHTPEVQEMIEDLGIPVMIDRSSYELEVLGRIEWVKLYGALNSVKDLLGKDPLFVEFKAVKEGNVWTVDKTWYQDTANVANLITDFNVMLTDGDPSKLTYMKKVS
ncbi:MAG: hypothetical protein IJI10_00145 [Eubacterium sp.]|nr:hypothetical protein [Eubacterium sp.]